MVCKSGVMDDESGDDDRKLGGSKQAHRVIHQPVSVVSQCALVPG